MAGKICTGTAQNNIGAAHIRSMTAFSEGLYYRAGGTAAARPATGNPHDGLGDDAETAWDEGWGVAHAAAGGVIDPDDAPCCSVPQNTILA